MAGLLCDEVLVLDALFLVDFADFFVATRFVSVLGIGIYCGFAAVRVSESCCPT